jgi:hypothetical protein
LIVKIYNLKLQAAINGPGVTLMEEAELGECLALCRGSGWGAAKEVILKYIMPARKHSWQLFNRGPSKKS